MFNVIEICDGETAAKKGNVLKDHSTGHRSVDILRDAPKL